MSEAIVNMNDATIQKSAAGLGYAELTVKVDGIDFPEEQWTDSAVVVLAWWCGALVQLLESEGERVEVRFMEGPFLAVIERVKGDLVQLTLVEAGLTRRTHKCVDLPSRALIDSVISAAARMVDACNSRGWRSRDIDELAVALKTLRRRYIRVQI